MILPTFSLLDTKTGIYAPPFMMAHVQLAIRAVKDLAADLNTSVGRHPADYMLVQVGTFDDSTAQFINDLQPISLVVALIEQPTQAPLFSAVEA